MEDGGCNQIAVVSTIFRNLWKCRTVLGQKTKVGSVCICQLTRLSQACRTELFALFFFQGVARLPLQRAPREDVSSATSRWIDRALLVILGFHVQSHPIVFICWPSMVVGTPRTFRSFLKERTALTVLLWKCFCAWTFAREGFIPPGFHLCFQAALPGPPSRHRKNEKKSVCAQF